jgi:hypothetical protein|nr:MAG TPA: SMI1-KNR4 cell-wall [Caudoviricetes sp.]
MSKVIDMVNSIKGVRYIGGCSEGDIQRAEKLLRLKFPNEYREYMLEFGSITFKGVELTGLNITGHLNVVDATLQERKFNPDFPKNIFIIENLGIDSIFIVGDEKGSIYKLQYDKMIKISSSFTEYLQRCKYR